MRGLKQSVILGAFLMVFCGVAYGDGFSDVPKTDPAYSAVARTVNGGYLSLQSDDLFGGAQPVTRREMAIVIEKLLTDSDQQNLNLSRNDIQELKTLLKAFKGYMADYDSANKTQSMTLAKLDAEQKVINRDMDRFQDSFTQKLEAQKKDQDTQNMYLWIGVAASAFLGLVVK